MAAQCPKERIIDEPTWRCQQNPFIGALGIQQPVILGEPQIDQRKIIHGPVNFIHKNIAFQPLDTHYFSNF